MSHDVSPEQLARWAVKGGGPPFDLLAGRIHKAVYCTLPDTMRVRREVVEHPIGTIKARRGAAHFLRKRPPRVATDMVLRVLPYNIARRLNIIGIEPVMAAVIAP